MNNKMKGLLKGLRYISQIFDDEEEEEKELQIGYPTNVKHVAHIGCDGPMDAISWMGQYKSTSASQNKEKFFDTPTKEISEMSIKPIDSSSSTEPLPESPAKRRHRRRSSASESPLGEENLVSRDKDSNRGSRHSRRHHSAGATTDSSNKEPSEGSSRRGRRHSKISAAAAEPSARDVPSIPKQPRRRKPKEETNAAAPIVAVGIP